MTVDYDLFMSSFGYNKIADLSASSVALFLSSVTFLNNRYAWSKDDSDLSDTEWDEIQQIVDTAIGEIMSSLVGLIVPHVMATASAFKFIPCDGGTYLKSEYPLLYGAIDPVYIISGTQFRVPDLRNRTLVGTGDQYALDDSGGVDNVILTVDEIPAHDHSYQQYKFGVDIESVGVPDPTGVGQPQLPQTTGLTGGGNAHENRMPYRALNYVIIAG